VSDFYIMELHMLVWGAKKLGILGGELKNVTKFVCDFNTGARAYAY